MSSNLTVIALTLFASAFFSGMEIAFVSADRLRLELNRGKNRLTDKIISTFLQRPGQFIATLLVGNNIALVAYSMSLAAILDYFMEGYHLDDTLRLILQTVISTLIILFAAEFIPKSIFRSKNNEALTFLALPAAFFYYLFYPVTRLSIRFSHMVLRWIVGDEIGPKKEERVFGKTDIDFFISQMEDQSTGQQKEEFDNEIKLFRNALDFSKIKVRDCMVPRPELERIELGSSIEALREKFIETGFSKILIYSGKSDNILGYAHSYDLFAKPVKIEDCLRPVSFVPETMEASKLLAKLLREHKSIAMVVDEFGGIAGMVTTEDILEEIFGEIEDEHDTPDFESKQISDDRFILSGRLAVAEINARYNTQLKEDSSYETLAGYLLFHHPNFPKVNSILSVGKYDFKILRCSRTRIEIVEMKLNG